MSSKSKDAAARRNLIVADIVTRTGIDEPMIDRLVREFYSRARHDPLIGPIFEREIRDWELHFARMKWH
jgi:hemoglobin